MPLALNPDIYRAVLECLPVGLYLVDRNRQIVFWNASAERITGYLGQEVIGRFCHDNLLMPCDENHALLCDAVCPLSATMLDGHSREADVFLRHKEGQRVPARVRTVPIRDDFGVIIGSAEFFEERTSGSPAIGPSCASGRESLDQITGLPDYPSFLADVAAALVKFEAAHQPAGILCIGIDHLDLLRTCDGNQAVRSVLHAVSQTVAQSIRACDVVGGRRQEQFIALVACPSAAALRSIAERAKRLVGLAGVPWWGDRLSVTVSMGGTMAREGDTVESFLARAEKALHSGMAEHNDSVLVV